MKLPHPKFALAQGRRNELAMLGLLYEEGCASARHLGRAALGSGFASRHSYHHRLIRRLQKASQVAWFSGPVPERLFYLTEEGAARIKEETGLPAEHWLDRIDYHSGRSGLTVKHDLGVLECRLALQETGLAWLPKRVLQAAWAPSREHIQGMPDALLGRPSDLSFWPEWIPLSLEFERSSKSRVDRFLKVYRAQALLGQMIAGVVLVTRPSQVDLWEVTLHELSQQPRFEILGRGGKQRLSVAPELVRFWAITTLEGLASAVHKARAAYAQGQAPWPWRRYQPWLCWRSLLSTAAQVRYPVRCDPLS